MSPAPASCPNEANHTAHPLGYIAKEEWAMRKLKTHRQERCPKCGLWKIWTPRKRHL